MPRFASQPSPAAVHLGSSQVMACEVNGDLVPFARWEKDRLPLEPSARLVQLPSGALVISNATEADAGLYRCLVENVGSSKASDEAQLQTLPGTFERIAFCPGGGGGRGNADIWKPCTSGPQAHASLRDFNANATAAAASEHYLSFM